MAFTTFQSQLIADVGISMGDEGKGRLIPELIEELRQLNHGKTAVGMVLKVNGGANSGHTAGGLKLNLLPAGIVDEEVRYLGIGAGVVADPRKALWEARPLQAAGYKVLDRLVFDERCMVSDLSHRLLDLAWEDYRIHVLGQEPRGSTGRGITPAYMDEVGQFQIYFSDFQGDRSVFSAKLRARLTRALKTIEHVCQVPASRFAEFFNILTQAELRANRQSIEQGHFPESEFDFTAFYGGEGFTLNMDKIESIYWEAGTALAENIRDLRELGLSLLADGYYIIGEFGQSYWLDKRQGFAPNVTASHTYTAEIFQSLGIPVQPVHTIGCCKAYDTKVGTHVFLTRMPADHPLAVKLSKLEFGVSTGRQRMVGWFDAVEKGDALRFGGFQDIVINKLDALTHDYEGDGKLLVCTHYCDANGQRIWGVPRQNEVRTRLKPVYAELEGWKEDISNVRSFDALPIQAKRYIAFCMEALLRVAGRGQLPAVLPNLRYIGVGPNPSQIIKDVPPTEELLRIL